MDAKNDIEIKLSTLKPILHQRFNVDKIGYFGSFARNEQTETSDLDILV
ncbi:MAG: nucleotidyltransferase domain-containing protein, partial [Cytophagales bacterium]|nr:nucleotidyltransferase domain-containing protein [Cytophagales bacterium]